MMRYRKGAILVIAITIAIGVLGGGGNCLHLEHGCASHSIGYLRRVYGGADMLERPME